MRRAQLAALLLGSAVLSLVAMAQSNTQNPTPKPILRRVALLLPPESADPLVQRLLAAERAERDSGHKRTSLFKLKPPVLEEDRRQKTEAEHRKTEKPEKKAPDTPIENRKSK